MYNSLSCVLCISGGFLMDHMKLLWLQYVSVFSYALIPLSIIEFQYGSPVEFVLFMLIYVTTGN